MGALTCLEPQYRVAVPDSPPELVSPSSSTYSSRPSEAHSTWRPVVPLSPPMSSYDQPSKSEMTRKEPNEAEDARKDAGKSDASNAPPRQQLPSLSSLFGPPSTTRPLHSPVSEHYPTPYSATSPLDYPRSAGGCFERSQSSSSYFPPTSAALAMTSRPRTVYEPRFDERVSYQPRPQATLPGPISTGISREPGHHRREESHRSESHAEYGLSNRWSSPNHQEVSSRGEPRLYQYQSAQDNSSPSQLAGHKHDHDGILSYRAGRDAHAHAHVHSHSQRSPYPNAPPTPGSSTACSETSIPAKDGLGPKIWTGTHFLPRFVRATEVPGEGMCYFYDDGTHCKTVIDGEVVNAHWGVTKAGKPRKRLAIACVTCREKKIKCDPDYPRCVQCEKFGRICKFKNAPRGGHNTSPSTPPADQDESPQRQSNSNSNSNSSSSSSNNFTHRGTATYELPPRPRRNSSTSSVSPRTTVRPRNPEQHHEYPAMSASKRMRISHETYPSVASSGSISGVGTGQRSPGAPVYSRSPIVQTPEMAGSSLAAPTSLPWRQHEPPQLGQAELPRMQENVLRRPWQTDSRNHTSL